MQDLAKIKRLLEAEKPYLAEEYGVVAVGVFGSYVRGEQRVDSDVDVLLELEQPPRIDLFDLVRLEDHLSQLLGVKVDVALRGSLRKRIGRRILEEVVPV